MNRAIFHPLDVQFQVQVLLPRLGGVIFCGMNDEVEVDTSMSLGGGTTQVNLLIKFNSNFLNVSAFG